MLWSLGTVGYGSGKWMDVSKGKWLQMLRIAQDRNATQAVAA